jgi:hypothetical protein
MDRPIQNQSLGVNIPGQKDAWEMVLGELRQEMSRVLFETWVYPLRLVSFQNKVFTVGAYNTYGKAWVEERLGSQISRMLEGLYHEPIAFKVIVQNGFYKTADLESDFKPKVKVMDDLTLEELKVSSDVQLINPNILNQKQNLPDEEEPVSVIRVLARSCCSALTAVNAPDLSNRNAACSSPVTSSATGCPCSDTPLSRLSWRHAPCVTGTP